MRAGGIENWLMEVLRRIDRSRFALDFLVHVDEPRQFDAEIHALGSRVIPCLAPGRPWTYAANFRRALAAHGPYDVIHSHVHHYSGFVLRLAAQEGIPLRVAHAHTDNRLEIAASSWPRRGYVRLMQRWLREYATLGLGCSQGAAAALFGAESGGDDRRRVYYCGIDLEPFVQSVDAAAVRRELGIPPGRKVVGHVGRFAPPKNHAMIVRIALELVRMREDVHFLLVGDGELRAAIADQVAQCGLAARFSFAGARSDVPRILVAALDAFVFPSHREGLPMAVVEAQAAGLPLIISDAITPEVEVLAPRVSRLSPQDTPANWAKALAAALDRPPGDRAAARRAIETSPFNIVQGVRELERMYCDGRP
jgi:glycosyltransferase involved in cell wall biosynthesis